LVVNGSCSMKVVHEGLVSMLGFVISIFHEFVRISWELELGFLEKKYIDQEHELEFIFCENDVVFEPLNKMDIWFWVLFWKRWWKIFLMFLRFRNLKPLCFGLVWIGNEKLVTCVWNNQLVWKCWQFCFENEVGN
jgi:hypothetical protein